MPAPTMPAPFAIVDGFRFATLADAIEALQEITSELDSADDISPAFSRILRDRRDILTDILAPYLAP